MRTSTFTYPLENVDWSKQLKYHRKNATLLCNNLVILKDYCISFSTGS